MDKLNPSQGGFRLSPRNLIMQADVYTPTLTNVANITASTAYECQYLRIGNSVIVSGRVDIDPTTASLSTQLGISLPIASNLGAREDCAGSSGAPTAVGMGLAAGIFGDITNNRAQLEYIAPGAGDLANKEYYFIFMYQII